MTWFNSFTTLLAVSFLLSIGSIVKSYTTTEKYVDIFDDSCAYLAMQMAYVELVDELRKFYTPTKISCTRNLAALRPDPECADAITFRVRNITRDSSSFFRALSVAWYGDESKHVNLREHTMSCVYARWDQFPAGFTDLSKDEYVEKMRNPDEFISQIEVVAASQLFEVSFFIYHHNISVEKLDLDPILSYVIPYKYDNLSLVLDGLFAYKNAHFTYLQQFWLNKYAGRTDV